MKLYNINVRRRVENIHIILYSVEVPCEGNLRAFTFHCHTDSASYMTHHIGRGCIGQPASLSLHIETMGSEKTMPFLLHKLHFVFKIASLRASNLLRHIFIINKSYLNKCILFNSFTYLSVCVCVSPITRPYTPT